MVAVSGVFQSYGKRAKYPSLPAPRKHDLYNARQFSRSTVASRIYRFSNFLKLINDGSRKITTLVFIDLKIFSHIIVSGLVNNFPAL